MSADVATILDQVAKAFHRAAQKASERMSEARDLGHNELATGYSFQAQANYDLSVAFSQQSAAYGASPIVATVTPEMEEYIRKNSVQPGSYVRVDPDGIPLHSAKDTAGPTPEGHDQPEPAPIRKGMENAKVTKRSKPDPRRTEATKPVDPSKPPAERPE